MTASAIDARIIELEQETMTQQTIRDILCDMLELGPTDYINSTTDLCYKLLDVVEGREITTKDKTMKELREAEE